MSGTDNVLKIILLLILSSIQGQIKDVDPIL